MDFFLKVLFKSLIKKVRPIGLTFFMVIIQLNYLPSSIAAPFQVAFTVANFLAVPV